MNGRHQYLCELGYYNNSMLLFFFSRENALDSAIALKVFTCLEIANAMLYPRTNTLIIFPNPHVRGGAEGWQWLRMIPTTWTLHGLTKV